MPKLFEVPDGTDIIELRKKINRILSDARKNAKPGECALCGCEQTSFCNSHSVPQLSLKNIADSGKVLQSSLLMGTDVVDIEKGVNNSGTFFYICNRCDGTFFQDYENEQNLISAPSDKILGEIAVKNILLQLSKRTQEQELHKELQRQFRAFSNPENLAGITGMDVRDYNDELRYHKNIVDNNLVGGYQILFWKVVPYRVPIATQSAIALPKDLEGNEINNVFDMSETTRMQFMHLAVLPLEEKSVILAFYHKKDKLYRNLRHQFNCSSDEKKLQFLNYVIFAHTENYYISKTIQSVIKEDEKLQLLSQENNGNPNLGYLGPDNYFGITYTPVQMDEVPNFLSEQWAIKDETN